ncbi:SGNH/GDSL hydrolase family protein [Dyadobacter koreensis]|nr:SGNH/GDSL hydrolase family protein [Dyadobacter koreensis]
MKLHLVFILFICSCIACMKDDEKIINTDPDTKNGLTYLALGDSYTIGESVTEAERWPVLFSKTISANGLKIAQPDIIAKTGWTTANLLSNISAVNSEKPYDLVSLLIGVNNQYQNLGLQQYRSEFVKLLQKSISFAGGKNNRVFVLSIPDWGSTPAGSSGRELIGKEIDQYNEVAKEECAKAKILFIDITPTSKKALTDISLVATDGLHYSGKMHQLWVDEASPEVKKLF